MEDFSPNPYMDLHIHLPEQPPSSDVPLLVLLGGEEGA